VSVELNVSKINFSTIKNDNNISNTIKWQYVSLCYNVMYCTIFTMILNYNKQIMYIT